ncbi:hypothetical protein [Anabaena sp. CA = ATCC 33047]|uniref:hypothetical protein n=1 Tax=Anabaena sp. (strain CA / ATCC 33047) TaxID=52271 RepID=UPI000A86B02A|nr:hypothetical protein [Anabaena sp. CA = ATCC 33047]
MSDRLHNRKAKMNPELVNKLVIYSSSTAVLFTVSLVIVKALFFYFSSLDKAPFPASIPWIQNQFECEKTGRNWNNNQCWDEEHSPWF